MTFNLKALAYTNLCPSVGLVKMDILLWYWSFSILLFRGDPFSLAICYNSSPDSRECGIALECSVRWTAEIKRYLLTPSVRVRFLDIIRRRVCALI